MLHGDIGCLCARAADPLQLASAGGFSVFAGVGERTREGNDLYKEMIETVRPRHALIFSCCLLACLLLIADGDLSVRLAGRDGPDAYQPQLAQLSAWQLQSMTPAESRAGADIV